MQTGERTCHVSRTPPPSTAFTKAPAKPIVTIDGRDIYLGKHGSRPSKREYELIGEWLQNGRCLPADSHTITVAELLNAYRKFAKAYYVKHGKLTDTFDNIKPMLALVRQYYGDTRATDFGPLALKSLQARMVEADASRRYINDQTARVRQMFKWAAGNELIPFEVYHRLTAVEGLRKGRTEARENGNRP